MLASLTTHLLSQAGIADKAIAFMVTGASIVIFGLGIVVMVWWMLETKIETGVGLAGIAGCLTAMAVSIAAGSSIVTGTIMVSFIGLVLMYPFAENKLAETELRGYNIELMDRAHQELNRRPDNVPAAFQLARSLYHYGMRGHAIALSQQTLDRLSNNQDPTQNRSIRDIYRNEEYELKNWKSASEDPRYYRPLACPQCKAMNPPGNLACNRCQSPYLLEIARSADPRLKVKGKIVLAWAMITGIIPFAAWAGVALKGAGSTLAVGGGLAALGLVLWWLFKLAPGETGEVRTSA